ncbi:MAG: DUF2384 domain-containing protein [Acidobacteria bacterium]|nr:MAG: DUF2384 domain-containing protein [Acidobacteriota bacterium]
MATELKERVLSAEELMAEVAEVVQSPEVWLDTPNAQLGGIMPRAMLESAEGQEQLHNLVQMIKHGMFS